MFMRYNSSKNAVLSTLLSSLLLTKKEKKKLKTELVTPSDRNEVAD